MSTAESVKETSGKPKSPVKKIILIVGAISLLYFLFGGNPNIYQIFDGYRQVKILKLELQNANVQLDSLKLELSRLESDTAYLERIAREKLGMAKTNEKVIKFVEDKK